MPKKSDHSRQIEWLTTVLAVVTFISLCLVYLLWEPVAGNRIGQLIIDSIPDALVAVVAIPIVYFIFTRHGIGNKKPIDDEGFAEMIRSTLNDIPGPDVQQIIDGVVTGIVSSSDSAQQDLPETFDSELYQQKFIAVQERLVEITPTHKILFETMVNGSKFQIINDSIQSSTVEVIVSSDDNRLRAMGGVAKAILDRAGPAVVAEINRLRAHSRRQGDIAITTGGALGARAIIHPAVIELQSNSYPTVEVVKKVVERCIAASAVMGARSIAFPILGGGTGATEGFTPWESIQAIIQQVIDCLNNQNSLDFAALYIYDPLDIKGDLKKVIKQALKSAA